MPNASNLSSMVLWTLRQKLRRLILNQQKLQPIFVIYRGGLEPMSRTVFPIYLVTTKNKPPDLL